MSSENPDVRVPHVLWIAWGFPPHRGPGTYRPLAAVNQLVAQGARGSVLTADTDTFDLVVGSDPSLCEMVDPRVRVVRVPIRHDTRDPVVSRWPAARAVNPKSWTRARAELLGQEFPEPVYTPWVRRATAEARALHDADPVDLVIATGNPYADFAVALGLHSHADVPFILDDRDSWLLDVYTGDPRGDLESTLPWFEQALEACRAMWFVNEPIADWHRTRFPAAAERIGVVENGWDPRLLNLPLLADLAEARRARDAVPVATYVGTVSPSLPLERLAEAWRLVRVTEPGLGSAELHVVGQLGHSGHAAAEHRDVARRYAAHGLVLTGRVPSHRITESYGNADVLVFAKEGGAMVTSGKVYEYVATGLPIVCMVEPQHDARRVLDGYPRLFDADAADVGSVVRAFCSALADARAPDSAERRLAAAEHGAEHRRDRVWAAAFREWGVIDR